MKSSPLNQLLAYPNPPPDPTEVRKAITWVEDRKIRLYDIDEREPLRTSGPGWNAAFRKYLDDVECPHLVKGEWAAASAQAKVQVLHWLFAKGLACEYVDEAETYNPAAAAAVAAAAAASPAEEEEGLPADFHERVHTLATRLGILPSSSSSSLSSSSTSPPFSSLLTTLQTILSVIQLRLSPAAFQATKEGQASDLQLDDFLLSYSTQDPVVDRVARAMTMLYVNDLRELQTDINDILVSAQEFTANPCVGGREGRQASVITFLQIVFSLTFFFFSLPFA